MVRRNSSHRRWASLHRSYPDGLRERESSLPFTLLATANSNLSAIPIRTRPSPPHPQLHLFNLFCDGSFASSSYFAGYGFILADARNKEIHSISPPQAEGCALLEGLKAAQHLNLSRIRVFSDSQILINNHCSNHISYYAKAVDVIRWSHISKNSNTPAHNLANFDRQNSCVIWRAASPPVSLVLRGATPSKSVFLERRSASFHFCFDRDFISLELCKIVFFK